MYEMYRIRQLAGLKEDDTTLAPQAQPTPDELDARMTPDEKAQNDRSLAAMQQATAGLDEKKDDIVGIGLAAALKTLPPEYQAAAKDVYVYNPDGTVDGDETMFKMAEMWANLGTQLYNLFSTLVTRMEGFIRDKVPEFVALPPDKQEQLIKDVADMKAGLEKMKADGEKAQAEWEKQKPELRQKLDQRANDRFSANNNGAQMVRGGAGQKTNIGIDPNNPGGPGAKGAFAGESADDKLLQKMLMIAGLR
jgi:hypothetical protein